MRRRHAFTLVELLVVVGVIAVLLALLLPVLDGARESARRTQCASNLRQIAAAFLMYQGENQGRYPGAAWVIPQPNDWIYWRGGRDLRDSAVARYLNSPGPDLFRCPSDDLEAHKAWYSAPDGTPEPYPYSYLFNIQFIYRTTGQARSNVIVNASEKMMLIEGEEAFMTSGRWDPAHYSSSHPQEDLLGTRHDRNRQRGFPDEPNGWIPPFSDDRRDLRDRGNAAFADGHVEYVTRGMTLDWHYNYPWSR